MTEGSRCPARLIALTPGTARDADVPSLVERVGVAAKAGLQALLVREPHLSDRAWLALVEQLRERQGDDLWIGGHDRAHLATLAELDGVHLGFRSLTASEVRSTFNEARWALGLSTHAGDPVPGPEVDYLFHGPLHDTPSKRGWKDPIGTEGLAAFVAKTQAPVFGIGGLTPERVAPALEAGAYGVAVLRGILESPDPGASVEVYRAACEAALV